MAACINVSNSKPVQYACEAAAATAGGRKRPNACMAFETLNTPGGAWLHANESNGLLECEGLLDLAMAEIDDKDFLQHVPGSSQPAKRARTRLTREQAMAIFLAKLGPRSARAASLLAAEFCITPKAVRDIWSAHSWAAQTSGLLVTPTNSANRFMPPGAPSPAKEAAAARVQRALNSALPAKLL